MRVITILFLLFVCFSSYGQDSYFNINSNNKVPAPGAASLTKFSEIPVSLFTGTPQIGLPLFNYCCGDLNLPIGLEYDASGIKVESSPTIVGVGWTLMAGGVVTRTIRGGSADPIYPYFENYLPLANTHDQSDFDKLIDLSTTKDQEPDAFFYNFNGYSGAFYIKKGIPVLKKHEEIKIDLISEFGVILGFRITTKDGTMYYFGIGKLYENAPSYQHSNDTEWYLKKIVSASSLDTIYLDYQVGQYSISAPRNSSFYYFSVQGEPIHCPNTSGRTCSYLYSGDVLKKIHSSSNDSIVFHTINALPNDPMTLAQPLALNTMKVFNNHGQCVKNYEFNIKSVGSIKPYTYKTQPIGYPYIGLTYVMNYRLYLDDLIEYGTDNKKITHHFEYVGRTFDGKDSLPSLLSFAQDFGGYYNGKDDNVTLIPKFSADNVIPNFPLSSSNNCIDDTYPTNKIEIAGADRSSDEKYMRYGTLRSIKYPTGGKSEFFFSSNKAPSGEILWRLKVDSIRYSDANNVAQKTKVFEYMESHLGRSIPSFYRFTYYNPNKYILNLYPDCPCIGGSLCEDENSYRLAIEISALPKEDLGLYEGPLVGYSSVKEYESGNGYTFYEYSMNDFVEVSSYHLSGLGDSNFTGSIFYQDYDIGPEFWCFGPKSNDGWKNGLLLRKTVYNSSMQIINQLINEYSYVELDKLPAIRIHVTRENAHYLYNEYSFPIYWIKQNSQVTIHDGVRAYKVFSYNANRQLMSEKNYLSDGSSLITSYLYPQDFVVNAQGSDNVYKLQAANILSPIYIEKRNGESGEVSYGEYVQYNVSNTIKPHYLYRFDPSISKESITQNKLQAAFNSSTLPPSLYKYSEFLYNGKGRLTSYEKTSDLVSCYYWGYNHSYSVARIDNYSTSELEGNTVLKAKLTLLEGFSSLIDESKRILLKQLNVEIRNLLPALAMITTYTYDPLIGMTSQTDPSGHTTYYEYDTFGRLEYVRDQDGNILNKYEYKYATQGTN